MSEIQKCEGCGVMIEDDPDCEVYTGNMRRLHETKILCAECRAKLEDEFEGAPI